MNKTLKTLTLAIGAVLSVSSCAKEGHTSKVEKTTTSPIVQAYADHLYHADDVSKTKANLLQFYKDGEGMHEVELEEGPSVYRDVTRFFHSHTSESIYENEEGYVEEESVEQYFELSGDADAKREQLLEEAKKLAPEDLKQVNNYLYSPCYLQTIFTGGTDLKFGNYSGVDLDILREHHREEYWAKKRVEGNKPYEPYEPMSFSKKFITDGGWLLGEQEYFKDKFKATSVDAVFTFSNLEFNKLFYSQCGVLSEPYKAMEARIDKAAEDGKITLDEFKELDEQRMADMQSIKKVFDDYAKLPPKPLEWPESPWVDEYFEIGNDNEWMD